MYFICKWLREHGVSYRDMVTIFLTAVLSVLYILSVPKFTANLYCICLGIPQFYTLADAVQICGKICPVLYNDSLYTNGQDFL